MTHARAGVAPVRGTQASGRGNPRHRHRSSSPGQPCTIALRDAGRPPPSSIRARQSLYGAHGRSRAPEAATHQRGPRTRGVRHHQSPTTQTTLPRPPHQQQVKARAVPVCRATPQMITTPRRERKMGQINTHRAVVETEGPPPQITGCLWPKTKRPL